MSGAQIKNHLQKTGGTMTGNLDMGLNKIKIMLTDGLNGAILRGHPSAGDQIEVRNMVDTGMARINAKHLQAQGGNVYVSGDVDGVDVSEIDQAKIITGTYTGNGVDNRTINVGLNLTAKNGVYIIITPAGGIGDACHRIEYSQGDLTMAFTGTGDVANKIQSLQTTGFQVGTHADVNGNGLVYRYTVLYEEP